MFGDYEGTNSKNFGAVDVAARGVVYACTVRIEELIDWTEFRVGETRR